VTPDNRCRPVDRWSASPVDADSLLTPAMPQTAVALQFSAARSSFRSRHSEICTRQDGGDDPGINPASSGDLSDARAAVLLRALLRLLPWPAAACSGLRRGRTSVSGRLLLASTLSSSVRRGRDALRPSGHDDPRTPPSGRTRTLQELIKVLRTQILEVVLGPDLDGHGLCRGSAADVADQRECFHTNPPSGVGAPSYFGDDPMSGTDERGPFERPVGVKA
jgi:hypothetical protein